MTEAHSPAPFRFGNTGPEQKMIIAADGSYVCSVQIQQTGGGMIARAMEPTRLANADFVLTAVNAYEGLVKSVRDIRQMLVERSVVLTSLDSPSENDTDELAEVETTIMMIDTALSKARSADPQSTKMEVGK